MTKKLDITTLIRATIGDLEVKQFVCDDWGTHHLVVPQAVPPLRENMASGDGSESLETSRQPLAFYDKEIMKRVTALLCDALMTHGVFAERPRPGVTSAAGIP